MYVYVEENREGQERKKSSKRSDKEDKTDTEMPRIHTKADRPTTLGGGLPCFSRKGVCCRKTAGMHRGGTGRKAAEKFATT